MTEETEQKLVELQTVFMDNKEKVIAKLLQALVNVQPAVHINAKPAA